MPEISQDELDKLAGGIAELQASVASLRGERDELVTLYGQVASTLGAIKPGVQYAHQAHYFVLARAREVLGLGGLTTEDAVRADAERRKHRDGLRAAINALPAEFRAQAEELALALEAR
ncbi:MAG: hypothetical protein IT462_05805 [Planctomycetes bacterium]|nr:hypothetical protein [Planctomycetota bacterium]